MGKTMKKIITLLALLSPLAVQAFPFDVEKELNGTEINIQTLDLGDNTASVTLTNYGEVDTICRVRFRNGPEVPRVRQATLAAGETANLVVTFSSMVIRMRVSVDCKQNI